MIFANLYLQKVSFNILIVAETTPNENKPKEDNPKEDNPPTDITKKEQSDTNKDNKPKDK